jgi:chemotaxis protein MotA
MNGPAALIVIGGTFAAILIQTPLATLKHGFRMFGWVFSPPFVSLEDGVEKVVGWSMRARKEGLLGLEKIAEKEADPFCSKALALLVDGSEPESIKSVLDVELLSREHWDLNGARIYENMGGYSPTIGIIGAVMGLIHVMTNLADPSSLGQGIATAFVATIYGVALANLLLFPVAGKLRAIIANRALYHEMMIDGVISIAEGENPRALEMKLNGYLLAQPGN